jgi:hypothetical protein
MKESIAVAAKGRRYVDHVRVRLDFSKDSESSSSKAAAGAAPGGGRPRRRSSGRHLRRSSGRRSRSQEGLTGASRRVVNRKGRSRGAGGELPGT